MSVATVSKSPVGRFFHRDSRYNMSKDSKGRLAETKHATTIHITEICDHDTSSEITLSSRASADQSKHPVTAPHPTSIDKLKEAGRLSLVRARVFWQDIHPDHSGPVTLLSPQAKFSHRYVEPLCTWWGRNARILLSQPLPSTDVQVSDGSVSTLVNTASHNYGGFYKADPKSEALQRLCLERLPLADADAVPLLASATHEVLAQFLGADFCYSTSTGYGSNYAAFPALMGEGKTVVIADQNCHSSMFSGMYLAQSGHTGRLRKFAHNDARDLEKRLQEVDGRYDRVIVAVEGLYSMDGNVPPLYDIHRLKEIYDFRLFCDEAHSLLSIGATGRGCIEYWNDNHPNNQVPPGLIDIRTATVSKAIGGIGGIIAGKAAFEPCIRNHITKRHLDGWETLSSSTMVQTMWVLGQPTLVKRRLHRLADMSRYCRGELARFGIHVYGADSTPIMPVYTGRPSYAARLSYVARRHGLFAAPVGAPAVPYWEGRVRVNLSAEHTDADVDKLVDAIVQGSARLGLCRPCGVERRSYSYTGPTVDLEREDSEASATFDRIQDIILRSASSRNAKTSESKKLFDAQCGNSIIEVGVKAQQHFGLGSGGSRWISGTFPPHLGVEALVSEITGTDACLTYPDSSIGLASTIAALCRPVDGHRRHYLLLPETAPCPVSEGFALALPKDRPQLERYPDIAGLHSLVSQLSAKSPKAYFTVYLHAPDLESLVTIRDVLEQLSTDRSSKAGMTAVIHSPRCIPRDPEFEKFARRPGDELLIFGSFHEAMGLAGAYLAGSKGLIQEMRYTSRGYMYTTSPQPFVMDMIRATLAKWMAESDGRGSPLPYLDGR